MAVICGIALLLIMIVYYIKTAKPTEKKGEKTVEKETASEKESAKESEKESDKESAKESDKESDKESEFELDITKEKFTYHNKGHLKVSFVMYKTELEEVKEENNNPTKITSNNIMVPKKPQIEK